MSLRPPLQYRTWPLSGRAHGEHHSHLGGRGDQPGAGQALSAGDGPGAGHTQWFTLGGHLVINGDVLMTPDATARLIQETSRHLALGRCGTAIELVNSQAISILRSFWSRIYQEADVPYCFVNNRQEAVDWLQQQIAAAQSGRAGGTPE